MASEQQYTLTLKCSSTLWPLECNIQSQNQAQASTDPFWRAARGSLLLRTRIMMMENRKKKQAMAKHMRYTDLYPTMMSQFTLFSIPGMPVPPTQKPGIWMKKNPNNTGSGFPFFLRNNFQELFLNTSGHHLLGWYGYFTRFLIN